MKRPSYLAVIAISLFATLFTGCAIVELIIDILNYEYICDGGTPQSGTTTDFDNREWCISCNNPTDIVVNKRCVPIEYTCENGTKADGGPEAGEPREKCKECDSGFALNNETFLCVTALTFKELPFINGTPSANSATISFEISTDALLWWVLFADNTDLTNVNGNDMTDPATFIANASTSGIKNSGNAGVNVAEDNNAYTYTIEPTGLTASTDYDLYVAISKADTGEALLSEKLDVATNMVGVPSFTAQPSITTNGQTSVEITFTPQDTNHNTLNFYWVLYDSAQTTPMSTQLKTDAIGSGGVMRSGGTTDTVTAEVSKQLTIGSAASPLTPLKDYYFYAVLEDGDGNLAHSSELPFTTIGYPFVCQHGTEVPNGNQMTANITNCQSCENYYRKETDNSCVATVYTCDGGMRDLSSPAADNAAVTNADIEKCDSCTDPSHIIDEGACEPLQFTKLTVVTGTATANTVQVAVTASHDAELHWVVYADGTTKGSAATVISEAATASTVGFDRSGTSGVDLTATTAHTITDIDGLTATTDYTLYAVITAQGVSILSSLDFNTTAVGVPVFDATPAASAITQTTANIAFTVTDSDDTTPSLYWVVYTSEQIGLDAATLKIDATGSGGVMRSGSMADTVTSGTQKTLTIGSATNRLTAKQAYYFYALVEDDATPMNQQLSAVEMFTTSGYPYVCTGGEPDMGSDIAPNINKCDYCYTNFTKVGDDCLSDGDADMVADVTDIDDDNDGLIEISSLLELHNIRHNLAGTSYDDEADDSPGNEGDTTGAPTATNKATNYVCGSSATGTCGYELMNDLSFDTGTDGTWSESGGIYTLDSVDDNNDYFDVDNGGWEPIGNATNPFAAVFEGNTHTITGLAIQRNDSALGLFGRNDGTIQNLTIENSLVIYTGSTNGTASGIVAGILNGATVSNVHITNTGATSRLVGSSSINNIGALAGTIPITATVTISDSSSSADVYGNDGDDNIGGLVGYFDNGTITSSYASGDVGGGNQTDNAGGLVGRLVAGSISDSYASGVVDGGNQTDYAGGLVGRIDNGSITASYANGEVNGGDDRDYLGGLIGYFSNGTITTSRHTTGAVKGGAGGDDIGGLIGRFDDGSITASYASSDVDGEDSVDLAGGLIGNFDNGSITASYASGTVNGGDDIDDVGGLVGRQSNGSSIVASYTTGNVDGGNGNDDVGGLVGRQSDGSIIASYASGDVDGGASSDKVGKLVGSTSGSGSITASYGFGDSVNGEQMGFINDMPATGKSTPMDASGLTDGSYFTGTEAGYAWSFSSGDPPKLLYADYDGIGGSTYSCTNTTLSVGGSDVPLTCGTSPLPGQ